MLNCLECEVGPGRGRSNSRLFSKIDHHLSVALFAHQSTHGVAKVAIKWYRVADAGSARHAENGHLSLATITGLYEACKPEILGKPVVRVVAVFQYLRGVLDAIIEQTDIDAVAIRVGELLDESLVVDQTAGLKDDAVKYRLTQSNKTWDLSKIDFEKLKEDFTCTPHKNIEIADLRAFIQRKLEQMLQQNAGRTDFATRLQGIIDRYNSGSSSADNYFDELVKFTKEMQAEVERHIVEGLTEEELELFDLIKKDKMTKEETQKVRLAAKSLLHRLREERPKVLIQDWFKDGQSRTRVRSAVEAVLDDKLPDTYDRAVFTEKCNVVFDMMLNYASQGMKWAVAA
jgi:type I restriction enzyme R subunit